MTGKIIDARAEFAERAEAVVHTNEVLRIAREASAPEIEWMKNSIRARAFLKVIGLDMVGVENIPTPDDLESPSTDPQVQEARRMMKKFEARRKGEQ